MTQLPQLRIAGYTAILAMHITNIYYMDWHRKQVQVVEERVFVFKDLENRFLTTWTFLLQVTYAFFGLACDIYTWRNSDKQSNHLPKFVEEIRDAFFSSIIWPSSWVVSTFFWTVFYYDRSLIFPKHLDVYLPNVSNHIIHTAIIPIVLFETMARPRIEPKSHLRNLAISTLYIGSYLLVLIYTFQERKVWLYPIFGILYGSVYFILLSGAVYLSVIGFYLMQWPISRAICMEGSRKIRQMQKRKKRD